MRRFLVNPRQACFLIMLALFTLTYFVKAKASEKTFMSEKMAVQTIPADHHVLPTSLEYKK
ncbi:MAG: hypothetical protein AAF824_04210 [Bacteroidota bacterium]